MRLKVMAIGAHPDDLEIYAFGTLAAYREMGAELEFVIATDGAKGGRDPQALRTIRMAEAGAAAGLLDVVPRFLDFPDGALVCDSALLGTLKSVMAEHRPDLVITHAANDYHGDHRALCQAVHLAASFSVPVVEMDTLNGTGFAPTIYVDTSAYSPLKRQAILLHKSQDPDRFIPMSETLGRLRASQCNHPEGMAEAFLFSPRFPFADIRNLLPPAPSPRPVPRRDTMSGNMN